MLQTSSPPGARSSPSSSGGPPAGRAPSFVWAIAVLLVLLITVAVAWELSRGAHTVTVVVDGFSETVFTTRLDVGALLADLGMALRPEDIVTPDLSTPLTEDTVIGVHHARPVQINADGDVRLVYSHGTTSAAVLAEAGYRLAGEDEVLLNERVIAPTEPLPQPQRAEAAVHFPRVRSWIGAQPEAVRLTLHRAIPLTVDDGTVPYTILTTAPTIGEALLRESVTLYLGDKVQPGLGVRVHSGMRVLIQRSKPLLITADGRTVRTRTRASSVGDALAELGIVVAGSDRVQPAMPSPVQENLAVQVVRVAQRVLVEREAIPFEAVLVPDDDLEVDQQRLDQQGEAGEFRRRFGLVFEDGKEIQRTLTDAWVAAEPITRVTSYGRKIVSRSLDGVAGTYWRKINMLATSYSRSTSGVSPDHPHFGITRLGWVMRKGLVAVDPTIIPLGSSVYVPGYGVGIAADTGGGIRSRRIDLGYDDENLVMWSRWVDVYLLDPAPPKSQIKWVVPNWPQ
jgi:resuscitation-promoting factor RpfB